MPISPNYFLTNNRPQIWFRGEKISWKKLIINIENKVIKLIRSRGVKGFEAESDLVSQNLMK